MKKPSSDLISGLDFAGLPSPPAILIELIDVCNSSDVSFVRLAEIIKQDAGVSSKVITAANSPVYRQWKEVNDINRLLVVLGVKTVKSIAITSAVQQFFTQVGESVDRDLDEIWHYSLSCAYIAKALAELTAYVYPEEAYLTGLLHRLGQLALLHNFPDDYSEIFRRKLVGEALIEAEREQFNVTSSEVGASLIDSWKIRSFISDAVLYQYEPPHSILDSAHLVKLLNLASRLSTVDAKPDNDVLDRADLLFGLNQSIIEDILEETQERVKAAAESLGIRLPSRAPEGGEENKDNRVRRDLAERIKGLALVGSVGDTQAPKTDFQDSLNLIQRDLGILFGLQSSCFLLYDEGSNHLQAVSSTEDHDVLLADITISTESERSLAARAFLSQSLVVSFEYAESGRLSVVDRQLSRVLDKEGVVYIPLISQENRLGLIAAGLDATQWTSISTQTDLLGLFAKGVVNTLMRQHAQAASEKKQLAEARDAFELEARKVIREANNPLGVIKNYLHILGMKLGDEHPAQEELSILKEEIERVGRIILRIRDIPQEMEHKSATVDLNSLITDVFMLFQSSLFATHDIDASLDLDERIPAVVCNRGHLKQILTNLIKNAVEAMENAGKLEISTHDKVHFNDKKYVEVVVQDNGPGIPDQVLTDLFSPTVNTKDRNHSGHGLAIVKNLVDELSGSISCASNVGIGTRIHLFLPRTTLEEPHAE
jgi:HD-like signal output (HDOD) protein/signal transduction histidine kinase